MFKHLFKKQTENTKRVTQDKAERLENTLHKIVSRFNVKPNTISLFTTDNKSARLYKFTLETLDNHKITVEVYSGSTKDKVFPREATLTIDTEEPIDIPYSKVPFYISSYGVTVKDKYTIMHVVKQLQTAYKQETTTFVEANDKERTRGMIVPGIVHIIDKTDRTILATVVIVHKVIKVKLPQLDDYITLGSFRIDPDHIQEFIDTFIL